MGAQKYDPSAGKMKRKAALPTTEQLKSSYEKTRTVGGSSVPGGAKKGKKDSSDSVQVMVRVRPFGDYEIKEATEDNSYLQSVINMPRIDQVLFLDHQNDYTTKTGFNFDKVFWSCTQEKNTDVPFASQSEVYEATGAPCLETAWEGINSCVFAYGQTGSGKTHTMMGDPAQITDPDCPEEAMGVIPRLCRALFTDMELWQEQSMKTGFTKQSEVEVRFLEIYNEKVRDLLAEARVEGCESMREHDAAKVGKPLDSDDLKVREHPVSGPYVHGTTVFKPKSYKDMIALVTAGNQARSIAQTKLNDRSSRSHAMFRISLTQTTVLRQERVGIGGPKTLTSVRRANINLVDLAGSENVKRSGAQGSTLLEAQKINLSLTTLRRVIDALIEQKPGIVVPYRDSTLTWLLRQDLGGNAKTYMLATVSPHHCNAYESFRTLEYAMRARSIVNNLQVNEDDTSKLLADMEKRIIDAQKAMDDMEGKASQEELEVVKTDLEVAVNDKRQMESRFSKAVEDAEVIKAQLEKTKERQVAQAFKSAVVIGLAKARLKTAHDEIESKKTEAEAAATAAKALKHDLADHRELVDSLKREKDLMKLKEDDMSRRAGDLDSALRVERERALSNQQRSDQHQQAMTERINELSQQMSDILAEHQLEKQHTSEHHDRELGAIVQESEDMAKEYQLQIQRLHIEREADKNNMKSDLRAVENDATYKQRLHHKDIERLQQELDQAHRKIRRHDSELVAKCTELQNERDAHALSIRQYEARLHRVGHEKTTAEEAIRTNGELLKDAMHDKESLRYTLSNLERKEEEYSNVFDDVKLLLELIHASDGNLPKDWTMQDVRDAVRAFSEFKMRYVSNRPNKEKLRQMLRADPARKGAERMRQMLGEDIVRSTSPERIYDEDQKLHVVMDGLKCPTLPRPQRSCSPPPYKGERDDVFTEADKAPYHSDPPVLTQQASPTPRTFKRNVSPNQTRSASPNLNGRRSVSPLTPGRAKLVRTMSPRASSKPKTGTKKTTNTATSRSHTSVR